MKSQAEADTLKAIKERADIKSLEILKEYEDDHQMCADVKINGIQVEFLWYDTLGFLEYWDESDRAFKKLVECLAYEIQRAEEEEFE